MVFEENNEIATMRMKMEDSELEMNFLLKKSMVAAIKAKCLFIMTIKMS
jgi:2-keto-4-pentenoate hydratase